MQTELTTDEALAYTAKSRATLYRHCQPTYRGRGSIPSFWSIADLDKLIARFMVQTGSSVQGGAS